MNSPFESILHTNTVPSEEQSRAIQALLEVPRTQLVEVFAEIARLQAKQRELQHFIDAHGALLSPARALPDDIVRRIFIAALPSSSNPGIVADEAPLLLCNICSSWRNIALTTPRLWASIHIVVPIEPRPQTLPVHPTIESIAGIVATWLSRSGAVPLNISMVWSSSSDDDDGVFPLDRTILASSRRWRNVQFTHDPDSSFLASLSPEDVPSLHTITLHHASCSRDEDSSSFLPLLATKSLRSVTLPGLDYYMRSPLCWKKLQHLSISGFATRNSAALDILSQCALLETCELYLIRSDSQKSSRMQPVLLPHLSQLSVSFAQFPDPELPRLFDQMETPSLGSFVCGSSEPASGLEGIPPLTLLFPSTASLRCLRFDIQHLHISLLVAVLTSMPALEELTLARQPSLDDRRYIADPNFLTHFTASAGRLVPVLCPLLRAVEFRDLWAPSEEAIVQFVQSRTGPSFENVARLARFCCEFRRPIEIDIMGHLKEAVAEGLSVELVVRLHKEHSIRPYSAFDGTDREPDRWGY
ncbi:hypothetical protein C8R43DRAFT_928921 [Mycena crocata]|nr:hypothetical protein C8R43DRAFT_928921 [Mycena crocata]